MSKVESWLNNMRDIWLLKEPNRIADILAENLNYYETPFELPLTKVDDVVDVWQEIKSQNIEYVEIDLFYEKDNVGMATWKFKEYEKLEHIGNYYISLDDEDKCKEFRQWWMETPETL